MVEVSHVLAFVVGLALVGWTIFSSLRSIVIPRSINDRITRIIFLTTRRLFDLIVRRLHTYERRDALMSFYAPVGLLALPVVWLMLVLTGYTGMFWATGSPTWRAAFTASGSSLLTLGFAPPDGLFQTILAFTEAALGLGLVALLIAYLPTIYSAFSRREEFVTMLEIRAGSPPSGIEMLLRYHRIHGMDRLSPLWPQLEVWFVDLDETHTSLGAIGFFRSPQPQRSWVTAAGAVLDAAALVSSTLDVPKDPQVDLCIRAGYIALRHIASFFKIPYDPAPRPDDAISIRRDEFDDAYNRLAAGGLPLKPDRDQCWRDFAGWRVNYDAVLIILARLTMAPPAPWSSDGRMPVLPPAIAPRIPTRMRPLR
jgi:hypothetical protein